MSDLPAPLRLDMAVIEISAFDLERVLGAIAAIPDVMGVNRIDTDVPTRYVPVPAEVPLPVQAAFVIAGREWPED